MNREYVIVCNRHKSLYAGTLLFWGSHTKDEEKRSFGGYTCDLDKCERYTKTELEKEREENKTDFPFYSEIAKECKNPFKKYGDIFITIQELKDCGFRMFHVVGT